MPLRDHFHPPVTDIASWEELHGAWPGIIAFRLNALLPPGYRSGVKIHLGSDGGPVSPASGGAALAWKAAAPVLLYTEEMTPPEYEVRVYDQRHSRRLVAAVEIVSPRNKDRPEVRDAFVSKCHALLLEEVCVV